MTISTIEDRAKFYRNLVMAVSVASIASVLTAVFLHRWAPLAGLFLAVPLTGLFLFFDSRRVRRWRAKVVEKALTGGLDVALFRKTISGFGHLPSGSLQAMLSTLPSEKNVSERQTEEQKVAQDEYDARTRRNELRILRTTCLLTLALVCLTGAAVYHSLTLLLFGGGLTILFTFFGRRIQP